MNEDELKPYFSLDNVREGAFMVANKLYGITITELKDMPVYHPDVRAFEVKDADGKHLAVFYTDYFPRAGKRAGAWMYNFREAYVQDGKEVRPIVYNVANFTKPTADTPSLLTIDEVQTLFHEFRTCPARHAHPLPLPLGKRNQCRTRFRRATVANQRTLGNAPRSIEIICQTLSNWRNHSRLVNRQNGGSL